MSHVMHCHTGLTIGVKFLIYLLVQALSFWNSWGWSDKQWHRSNTNLFLKSRQSMFFEHRHQRLKLVCFSSVPFPSTALTPFTSLSSLKPLQSFPPPQPQPWTPLGPSSSSKKVHYYPATTAPVSHSHLVSRNRIFNWPSVVGEKYPFKKVVDWSLHFQLH